MSERKYFQIIFIVLVYREHNDLMNFLSSIKKNKIHCKIIIVDSFFNKETSEVFEKIASDNKCDFIVTENKGYGSGNNRGIEYAQKKYRFDYLIVSNPDVEINEFDSKALSNYKNCISGPITANPNSINKNPYWYRNIKLLEWFLYFSAKHSIKYLFYLTVFLYKIDRLYYNKIINNKDKVFAIQGTFIIFHKEALEKLGTPFDENIFLYSEEAHLAHLAKSKGIPMFIIPQIKIYHKSGGSSGTIKKSIWKHQKKSICLYYERWHRIV